MAFQSIVPEVDEEEEEQTMNTLSATFPYTEESPKNLKRKSSLVELVLVSVHTPWPPVPDGCYLGPLLSGYGIPDPTQS